MDIDILYNKIKQDRREAKKNRLYDSYLLTEKKLDSVKIIIITARAENDTGLFRTAKRFKEICKKRRIDHYVLFIDDCYITNEDGIKRVHNIDDKKGFIVDGYDTAVIIRGGGLKSSSNKNNITQLEKSSIFCLNNRDCIEVCSDKFRTLMALSDQGIVIPKTVLLKNLDNLNDMVEYIGGKFPIILKTLFGSKGIGVFYSETYKSLKSMLQTIWKINEEEEILMQQFIKAKYDIRAHVLGNNVIAAMKRYVIEDDFRSNFSQGGKVENIKLTDEQIDICLKSASIVGGQWVGVDIIEEKGETYVIEVNSSPGTTGIELATKDDVCGKIIDFCLDKKNWIKSPLPCGYKEYVGIVGISDEIKAKFDTGNGSYSVIHVDKQKVNDKKTEIKIWINGKRITKKIIEVKKVNVGGLRDYEEERFVVLFDVIFNNKEYKDIKFTLDDRTNRTPILISRGFMKLINVSIDPSIKYKLSSMRKERK